MLNAKRYAPMNARDKMPFEVTPIFYKLQRYDAASVPPAAAAAPAAQPASDQPAARRPIMLSRLRRPSQPANSAAASSPISNRTRRRKTRSHNRMSHVEPGTARGQAQSAGRTARSASPIAVVAPGEDSQEVDLRCAHETVDFGILFDRAFLRSRFRSCAGGPLRPPQTALPLPPADLALRFSPITREKGSRKPAPTACMAPAPTLTRTSIAGWQLKSKAAGCATTPTSASIENTYLIGPRVPITTFHRITPYGKFLVGMGNGSFLTGNTFVLAYGGGVDYRLSHRFTLRAFDFEYQQWRLTPVTLTLTAAAWASATKSSEKAGISRISASRLRRAAARLSPSASARAESPPQSAQSAAYPPTPRSRWCAIPAPTAKNDARISGYSGENPCEPRVPRNRRDQAAAERGTGVVAGLEHHQKCRIGKGAALVDCLAIENLRDAAVGSAASLSSIACTCCSVA